MEETAVIDDAKDRYRKAIDYFLDGVNQKDYGRALFWGASACFWRARMDGPVQPSDIQRAAERIEHEEKWS